MNVKYSPPELSESHCFNNMLHNSESKNIISIRIGLQFVDIKHRKFYRAKNKDDYNIQKQKLSN